MNPRSRSHETRYNEEGEATSECRPVDLTQRYELAPYNKTHRRRAAEEEKVLSNANESVR